MNLDTLIEQDWSPKNQQGIRRALGYAFRDVEALCDPDRHPFFNTPNRVFGLGYNRWLIADYWMEEACKRGWIEGIRPAWEKNARSLGPIKTLVLHGERTKVTVVHLSHPEESPRDSRMRCEGRIDNERSPYLTGWDEAAVSTANGPLNLVLVYGDKSAEFAFLRAYNNSQDLTSYRDVTANLFGISPDSVVRIDGESVPDIRIDLLPPNDADEDQDEGLGPVAVR